MTDTVLTNQGIAEALVNDGIILYAEEIDAYDVATARTIEQAVLQSEQVQAWKKDAALGRIAMKFVDRAGDYCKEDPAEQICDEFNKAMSDAIDAAMEGNDHE